MVYKIFFLGILVESYGTWLLFQRLDDSSKDSDIPKNVPFAFAINNRNIGTPSLALSNGARNDSAREGRHNKNCIEYKTSARRLMPLEPLARGCSGSKFFCTPGPAVQGRSSRAPSPARPSLDLDTPFSFSLAVRQVAAKRLTKNTKLTN